MYAWTKPCARKQIAAAHNHEKWNAQVSVFFSFYMHVSPPFFLIISIFYAYGAPPSGPSGRRSSANKDVLTTELKECFTLKVYFAQIKAAPDTSSSAKYVQEINFNVPVVLYNSSG